MDRTLEATTRKEVINPIIVVNTNTAVPIIDHTTGKAAADIPVPITMVTKAWTTKEYIVNINQDTNHTAKNNPDIMVITTMRATTEI